MQPADNLSASNLLGHLCVW